MSTDNRDQITANLLIENIYNREYDSFIEEKLIMMKILCHIEFVENINSSYFKFINDPIFSSYYA